MHRDPLKFNYYLRKRQYDELMPVITCKELCIYIALKLNYRIIRPSRYFIKNINFYYAESDEGIIQIDYEDSLVKEPFEIIWEQYDKTMDAFARIHRVLKEGQPVLINTYPPRLPFYKDFIGMDYIDSDFSSPHLFLIVKYISPYFYYHETPWNRNKENFTPYKDNDQIGIIHEQDLSKAFEVFTFIGYLKVNQYKLYTYSNFKVALYDTIANYKKTTSLKDGMIFYYGEHALEKLIELCTSKKLLLDKNYDKNLYEYLLWKLYLITNRRRVLIRYIKENSYYRVIKYKKVLKYLNENVQLWTKIIFQLDKKYNTNKLLDFDPGKFYRISILERLINNEMSDIIIR